MRSLRTILRRLAGLLGYKRSESDLTAELESHLGMEVENNLRRGMSPEEARRQALLRLGGVDQARQSYRRQESLPILETLFQDVRYGLRTLRKNPGFTAVAIITLALGIGANSAIFSIVNGVLLRPLPYQDPRQLVRVFNTAPVRGIDVFGGSPPDFRALRERNHTLSGLSAVYFDNFNLTAGNRPERVRAGIVSTDFFATLGVKPMLGRTFAPAEEQWGSQHVAIVSERFWHTHLKADPDIFGKTFTLNGQPYNVIGVLPSGFYVPDSKVEVWIPMAWKPRDNMDSHNNYFVYMVGRLRPGTTQAQASTDLNAIMLEIAQQFPENKDIGVGVKSLGEDWLGDSRPALLVLLGAVGLVLLIACVNVANLLLARSAARGKEIGIRSALGASHWRLLRQFMTENLLLAVLGASIGLALAYFSLRLLPLAGNVLPRIEQVHLDGWVLLFTVTVAIITALLFGLLPALQSSRSSSLNHALKEAGRTSQAGASSAKINSGLVISEVSLALVLLIGSGLAIRSLHQLLKVDSGFSPEHVLTFNVSLPEAYDNNPDPARQEAPPRVAAFFREAVDGIERIPGVKSAGSVSSLPLNGETWTKFFVPLDRPLPAAMNKVEHTQYRAVYGHYFNALGVRLIKGRYLDEHDVASTTPSVVVNETLARKYWPDSDTVGKQIMLSPPENLVPKELIPPGAHIIKLTIVGVVSDVHYGTLDQHPEPLVYASIMQQDYSSTPCFTVRATGDPTALISSVRSVIAQFDKDLPMADVLTMDDVLSASVAQPKLEAILLGLFGGLAMVLAAVGIFGVMSYSVSQRTGEIGVRMALGADRGDVLAMICRQGLILAGIGMAAGLVLAVAGTRLISKLLFGVSPTDPLTFASVVALLAFIALLACYIPARRATKVDPMVALRYE